MLVRFGRLYWNQMGPDVYGTVENAMRQMVEDGGEETRQVLRKELMFLERGGYAKWFAHARYDRSTVRQLGGAFILPEDVPLLLIALETGFGRRPS